MFAKKSPRDPGLQAQIDNLNREMSMHKGDSVAFAAMNDQLVKLYGITDHHARKSVSPDTLALVAANLLGIIMIINNEQTSVITSKALGFVRLK